MPVGGGTARQMTWSEHLDFYPSWSPDGQEISFRSTRSGSLNIWILPARAGTPRQVTYQGASFHDWSPDGQWLAFMKADRLWRVPAEGGDPEVLSEGPTGAPRWAPDGRHIYFVGRRDRSDNVWAVSTKDGSERPVTDLRGKRGSIGRRALATDGEYLYFTWEEDTGDIWVMDVVTDESE